MVVLVPRHVGQKLYHHQWEDSPALRRFSGNEYANQGGFWRKPKPNAAALVPEITCFRLDGYRPNMRA